MFSQERSGLFAARARNETQAGGTTMEGLTAELNSPNQIAQALLVLVRAGDAKGCTQMLNRRGLRLISDEGVQLIGAAVAASTDAVSGAMPGAMPGVIRSFAAYLAEWPRACCWRAIMMRLCLAGKTTLARAFFSRTFHRDNDGYRSALTDVCCRLPLDGAFFLWIDSAATPDREVPGGLCLLHAAARQDAAVFAEYLARHPGIPRRNCVWACRQACLARESGKAFVALRDRFGITAAECSMRTVLAQCADSGDKGLALRIMTGFELSPADVLQVGAEASGARPWERVEKLWAWLAAATPDLHAEMKKKAAPLVRGAGGEPAVARPAPATDWRQGCGPLVREYAPPGVPTGGIRAPAVG